MQQELAIKYRLELLKKIQEIILENKSQLKNGEEFYEWVKIMEIETNTQIKELEWILDLAVAPFNAK